MMVRGELGIAIVTLAAVSALPGFTTNNSISDKDQKELTEGLNQVAMCRLTFIPSRLL